MAILLHNLLARSPKLTDLPAISVLFAACAAVEDGFQDNVCSEQDVLADWRRPGFNLENDAWIITTKQGQVISYADLWMDEQGRIEMRVRVHRSTVGAVLVRSCCAWAKIALVAMLERHIPIHMHVLRYPVL
jgi:hypothetical protein